jgi:hypothetical protein
MMAGRLRADVSEEAYGIVARVRTESEFRSDRYADGFRIGERLRARGRSALLQEESGDVVVRISLGDSATDDDFARAAEDVLEAASW